MHIYGEQFLYLYRGGRETISMTYGMKRLDSSTIRFYTTSVPFAEDFKSKIYMLLSLLLGILFNQKSIVIHIHKTIGPPLRH